LPLFLHFTYYHKNGINRTNDKLWKLRDLFEIKRTNFSKLYNPYEYLAVDEVIVKFQENSFQRVRPEKCKVLASKYSKYVTTGYTYDMNVYPWKDDKWPHNS
jgi:hypothetical protein